MGFFYVQKLKRAWLLDIKKSQYFFEILGLYWGLERIRTAVGAFAEPSLAARPRDHFSFEGAKIHFFFIHQRLYLLLLKKIYKPLNILYFNNSQKRKLIFFMVLHYSEWAFYYSIWIINLSSSGFIYLSLFHHFLIHILLFTGYWNWHVILNPTTN